LNGGKMMCVEEKSAGRYMDDTRRGNTGTKQRGKPITKKKNATRNRSVFFSFPSNIEKNKDKRESERERGIDLKEKGEAPLSMINLVHSRTM
jgi:hypothetical protein